MNNNEVKIECASLGSNMIELSIDGATYRINKEAEKNFIIKRPSMKIFLLADTVLTTARESENV